MHLKVPALFLLLLCIALSCQQASPLIADEAQYQEEWEAWQEKRVERLKSKTGWLNLAGLYWLEEGDNSFGSDPANKIVFPEKASPFCGSLILENGRVTLKAIPAAGITLEGAPVEELQLEDDQGKNTTLLEQGDLAWFVIKRGEMYGIRLRDYAHPRLRQLDHIPAYPVNLDYVVEASLRPFDSARTMEVATPVTGFTESYDCPGTLDFILKGKKLTLLPFKAGNGYFLVIGDETSAVETYGAGRFMYTVPDSAGRIILDFNRAYNPPCAFSPFATCPMPPRENILPIAIEAGEKAVHFE